MYMNVIDTVLYYSGSSLLEARSFSNELIWNEMKTKPWFFWFTSQTIKMDGLIND